MQPSGVPPKPPKPRSPEGFRNPAQTPPPTNPCLGGVLIGAEARAAPPRHRRALFHSRSARAPRRLFLKRAAPMSTGDDREKRREESPEWHRARAKSLREHGFTKMAEEHEQIAQAIEGGGSRNRRNTRPPDIALLPRVRAGDATLPFAVPIKGCMYVFARAEGAETAGTFDGSVGCGRCARIIQGPTSMQGRRIAT
jgi:hypothetical protein